MMLPNNYREEYYQALIECLCYVKSDDCIRATIAIGKYEEWERRIIGALGAEGEEIVLSIKSRAAEKGRELGIEVFDCQIESLRDHRRVRELYPIPYEFNPPRGTCDVDIWQELASTDGELLSYNIIATIIYDGDMYLEIVYPDEIKTRRRLAYYRVEQQSSRILLRLVENEALHEKLYSITINLL